MEYLEGEIDFLAVFSAPEKRWYIPPFSAVRGRKNLTLHANGGGVDGEYLESWDLLRGRCLELHFPRGRGSGMIRWVLP